MAPKKRKREMELPDIQPGATEVQPGPTEIQRGRGQDDEEPGPTEVQPGPTEVQHGEEEKTGSEDDEVLDPEEVEPPTPADEKEEREEKEDRLFSWTSVEGVIREVMHQRGCTCCWTIAAAHSTEAAYKIFDDTLVRLSSQQLLDCAHSDEEVAALLKKAGRVARKTGCYETKVEDGFKFIKEHGIVSEAAYPFKGKRTQCRQMPAEAVTKLRGYGYVYNVMNDKLIIKCLEEQPLVGVVKLTKSFANLKKAIYCPLKRKTEILIENDVPIEYVVEEDVDFHAVLITGHGYDKIKKKYFYEIKNSYGLKFGDKVMLECFRRGALRQGGNLSLFGYYIH